MARATFLQRLGLHQARIGETCVYTERGHIMVGTLTALRWEDAYLEVDLHLTGPRLGKLLGLQTQTLTVGCARTYLGVKDRALLSSGYVVWLLLTEPGRVREFMAAVAAGMDGVGRVKLLRRLAGR